MANNFLKSLKSAFVTEVETEDNNQSTTINGDLGKNNTEIKFNGIAPSVVEKIPVDIKVQPVTTVPEIDEDVVTKLCDMLEECNLPGPDYIELMKVAGDDNMKRAIPDENSRITCSFISMRANNPQLTKERVITSIAKYIEMVEKERENGLKEFETLFNKEVVEVRNTATDYEKQMFDLQQKLNDIISKHDEITHKADENEKIFNEKHKRFVNSVDMVVSKLKQDSDKLSKLLVD